MKHVCILWKRWGEYHLARLRAAVAFHPELRVTGLQTASFDSSYLWAQVQPGTEIPLRTIFHGRHYDELSPGQIRRAVCRTLDEIRPDAVAIYGYVAPEAYAALNWARAHRRTAILMSESNRFDVARRPPVKEWVKAMLVRQYDAAICAGTCSAEYLAELGLPQERIFSGHDVVDNRYFADKVAEIRNPKSEIRNRHSLPEKFFLASARFVEKKNLPRLLQAYARYRQLAAQSSIRHPPSSIWDMVLLGDGPLRPQIEARISELGLRDSVHLPGFKQYPDLPTYYACASAFVHASLVEQWGLVVNEAMASGLPVLVSNRCGCVPDLVKEGVNGFTFDPYNIEEMAELMLRVSKLEARELERMGEASRRIIAHWGPERFAQGLKQAVDKALEVGPRKPSVVDRLLLKALMFC